MLCVILNAPSFESNLSKLSSLFAGGVRTDTIARARELLNVAVPQYQADDADARNSAEPQTLSHPCPCCGGRMIIIETFERGCSPRTRPAAVIRIDTS